MYMTFFMAAITISPTFNKLVERTLQITLSADQRSKSVCPRERSFVVRERSSILPQFSRRAENARTTQRQTGCLLTNE